METKDELAQLLEQYMGQAKMGDTRLSALANERLNGLARVSRSTVRNWRQGTSATVQDWRQLIGTALALGLEEVDTNRLLRAAHLPEISDLWQQANVEERRLLSPWMEPAPVQAILEKLKNIHQDILGRRLEEPPFQAIPDNAHFVGREEELQAIKMLLSASQHVMLLSLEGMAGVGKTVLAAHVAYQLRPCFPDGVLWAQLDVSDTMYILSAFAAAYGYDVSEEKDVGSRSAMVRQILANKRALIILDNAIRSEDIEHLLPPTGNCAVIITSRRRNLSATRGAHHFHIKPFDRQKREALALFRKLIGEERTQEATDKLVEIAEMLGHLPLAVDIAASRLAQEPNWEVSDFLNRIRQETQRLKELEYGDDLGVRASFNVSYNALRSRNFVILLAKSSSRPLA